MHNFIQNFFNGGALHESKLLLRIGLFNTLKLAGLSFGTSLVLGLLVAYARTRQRRFARNAAITFIDIIRAMPPLVTLMLVDFLVPSIVHIQYSPFVAAVISFAMIHGAYVGEVYRGGMMALDKGHLEAARAAGLSRWQVNRLVVAPLVLGVIIPPLTNEIIFVVRNSSLAYFIGYNELLLSATRAVALTANESPLTVATGLYAIILLILQGVSLVVERKMDYASDMRPFRRPRWGIFRRSTPISSEAA